MEFKSLLKEVISSQRTLILRSDNMEEKLNLVMASQKQTTSESTTDSTREHEVPVVKKVTTLGGETDKAREVAAIGAVPGKVVRVGIRSRIDFPLTYSSHRIES
jgi:hypothetical protein